MSNRGPILARRTLLLAGFSILALPFGPQAQALTQYESYVSGIANDVIKLANSGSKGQALRQKFNSLLGQYTDVPSVAQFSLGKYRKDLPDERRSEYNKLVLNYIS